MSSEADGTEEVSTVVAQAPDNFENSAAGVADEDLPKKPLSAYFMFLADNRASITEAAKAEGKKLTAAGVTQLLGAKWKALSEEDKAVYTDRNQAAKEDYLKALKALGLDEQTLKERKRNAVAAGSKGKGKAKHGPLDQLPGYSSSTDLPLPVGTIKRVIGLDTEAHRQSAEANTLITKCTELFLHMLGQKAYQTTRLHKRSAIKGSDFYQTIRDDPALEFLRGPMPVPEAMTATMVKADAARDRQLKKQKTSAKPKSKAPSSKQGGGESSSTRDITAIFSKMTELSDDYRRSPHKSPTKARKSRFAQAEQLVSTEDENANSVGVDPEEPDLQDSESDAELRDDAEPTTP